MTEYGIKADYKHDYSESGKYQPRHLATFAERGNANGVIGVQDPFWVVSGPSGDATTDGFVKIGIADGTGSWPDIGAATYIKLENGKVTSRGNLDFGAFYADMAQIGAPANPASNVRRLFVDSGTGKLSVRTSAGATVSLEESGGGGGTVGGTGTAGTITKWAAGGADIEDSVITESGGNIAMSGDLTVTGGQIGAGIAPFTTTALTSYDTNTTLIRAGYGKTLWYQDATLDGYLIRHSWSATYSDYIQIHAMAASAVGPTLWLARAADYHLMLRKSDDTELMRVTNAGNMILAGDLAVNGGDVTVTAPTGVAASFTMTSTEDAVLTVSGDRLNDDESKHAWASFEQDQSNRWLKVGVGKAQDDNHGFLASYEELDIFIGATFPAGTKVGTWASTGLTVIDDLTVDGGLINNTKSTGVLYRSGVYGSYGNTYAGASLIAGFNVEAHQTINQDPIVMTTHASVGARCIRMGPTGFEFLAQAGSVTAGNALSTQIALLQDDGDFQIDGNLTVSGDTIQGAIAMNLIAPTGSMVVRADGTGQHMYFDAGGTFYWRDEDSARNVVAELASSTGRLILGYAANTADPIELLRFRTERAWSFRKRSTGASTRLALESDVGSKNFWIGYDDGVIYAAKFFVDPVQANCTVQLAHNVTVDGDLTVSGGNVAIGDGTLQASRLIDAELNYATGDLYVDFKNAAAKGMYHRIESAHTSHYANYQVISPTQNWAMGMYGSTNWVVRDVTGAATRMELTTAGNLQIDGDLTVSGNDIKDFGGNVIVSSNGAGYIDYLGQQGAPSDNDVLAWDTVTSKWIVQAQTGGGGPGTGTQYTIPVWATTTTLGDSIIKQNSGATLAEVAGHFYITGDKEMGSVQSGADPEGVVLQIDYADANTSSRLFFREANNNLYGASIIYAAQADPIFDGTTFGALASNYLYFLTHDNSLTGTVFMSVLRGSTTVNFPGALSWGGTTTLASSLQVRDVGMIGLATWCPCTYYVNSAAEAWDQSSDMLINSSTTNQYLLFLLPLPPLKGTMKLYVTGVRFGLSAATTTSYVTGVSPYGLKYTGRTYLTTDDHLIDRKSAGLYTYNMANIDCSTYEQVIVDIQVVLGAVGALGISSVSLLCYYA